MAVTTIEQAAYQALQRHLSANLSDVTVFDHWPDDDKKFAGRNARGRVVTIIQAGDRKTEWIDPYKSEEYLIHALVSAAISAPTATDEATALTRINECRASYEEHRVDLDVHDSADTTNAITLPVATTRDEGIDLANDLLAQIQLHIVHAAHENADTKNVLVGVAAVASGDLSGLISLTNSIAQALMAHYAARIDAWTVALCRMPMQLDVWTVYETDRNELEALLAPLLNTSTLSGGDVVRLGVLVELDDGWKGTADFLFETPRRTITQDSVKKAQHRLTYSGFVDFSLEIKAQSPRMAVVTARARLANALPVPDSTPTKQVVLTSSSTTISGS